MIATTVMLIVVGVPGVKLKIKIQEWHPIFCLMNSGAVDRRHQENRRVQEIIENSWPLANEK